MIYLRRKGTDDWSEVVVFCFTWLCDAVQLSMAASAKIPRIDIHCLHDSTRLERRHDESIRIDIAVSTTMLPLLHPVNQ